MNNTRQTVALIILDGWGINKSAEGNAIQAAETPFWDELVKRYPQSQINTSGLDVGLPEGQVGNSEVGHMSIGAGRTIYQNLTLINQAIRYKTFFDNTELVASIGNAIVKDSALHVMGLLSAGGVHSHVEHISALCEMAAERGLKKIYVHAFLDGRDTPPKDALKPIQQLESDLKRIGCGKIVSVIGRYFAMDRDERWDRTEKAYRLIVDGKGEYSAASAEDAVNKAYELDLTDEFCPAISIGSADDAPLELHPDDEVVFMNFRPDRARQLTKAFTNETFDGFSRNFALAPANFVTLTKYAEDIKARCAFPPQTVNNSLGEYLSLSGKRQLRIAETEKYAHVTFFFNGGSEEVFPGESRTLIPSPNVATYDLKPEMSAYEVTEQLSLAIKSNDFDLIVCNFANGDMVGHTGDFNAAVKAVETLDKCLTQVIGAIEETGAVALITADHGNVENMIDSCSGQAHTAHTSMPVPLVYVGSNAAEVKLNNGSLIDLAPTILDVLDMSLPAEMTGRSLITA